MKQDKVVLSLALLLATLGWARASEAQNPTAIQRMQLSAFGGATGDFTGLGGGKNVGITAGVDLAVAPVRNWLRPTVEVRGTYPTSTMARSIRRRTSWAACARTSC